MGVRTQHYVIPKDVFQKSSLARAFKLWMTYFVAIFGYSWIFISGATILINQSSSGVSVLALMIYLTVSLNWVVYGFLRRDPVIVIGSLIAIVANIFVLTAVFIVNNS